MTLSYFKHSRDWFRSFNHGHFNEDHLVKVLKAKEEIKEYPVQLPVKIPSRVKTINANL